MKTVTFSNEGNPSHSSGTIRFDSKNRRLVLRLDSGQSTYINLDEAELASLLLEIAGLKEAE
jgi:hypothetical protein